MLGEDPHQVVGVEGGHARAHLVEDDAERIHVGPVVHSAARALLGRHIMRRPEDLTRPSELAGGPADLGDAEVQHLDEVRVTPPADEIDVVRLEVPVDDAHLVGRPQRSTELLGDVHHAHGLHAHLLLDRTGQVDAVQELHDEVRGFVGEFTEVADVDDVLVADRRRALRFLAEAGDDLLITGDIRAEHLDRQRLVQDDVAGLVDQPHAAFAEDLLDLVATVDGLADETVRHFSFAVDHAEFGRHPRLLDASDAITQALDSVNESVIRSKQTIAYPDRISSLERG